MPYQFRSNSTGKYRYIVLYSVLSLRMHMKYKELRRAVNTLAGETEIVTQL